MGAIFLLCFFAEKICRFCYTGPVIKIKKSEIAEIFATEGTDREFIEKGLMSSQIDGAPTIE